MKRLLIVITLSGTFLFSKAQQKLVIKVGDMQFIYDSTRQNTTNERKKYFNVDSLSHALGIKVTYWMGKSFEWDLKVTYNEYASPGEKLSISDSLAFYRGADMAIRQLFKKRINP